MSRVNAQLNPPRHRATWGERIAIAIFSTLAALFILCIGFLLKPSWGHEFLLNGTKSPAGEWCCGAEDCGLVSRDAVHVAAGGYSIVGTVTYGEAVTGNASDGPTRFEHVEEFWPYRDVLPSPDGATWRCKRPDGSPRCKFTGPPGS